jgi:hypothetical protein
MVIALSNRWCCEVVSELRLRHSSERQHKMGKFLAEQRTKIQSLLGLRDIACYSSRCSPDHTTVVCNTGAVNIEAGQDLGYALIEAKNDLNMTRWICRGNGDGVLGSDSSRFLKDAVPNLSILSYIGDFKVDTILGCSHV